MLCAVASAFAVQLHAQTAAADTSTPAASDAPINNDASNDKAVQLPAFEIASEKDTSYVGNSSLSSTRVAVDLSELSQSVKVLNNSFLTAINPTMMSDVLDYVGGGQNGALNWTPGRMNIRGFTGDADYMDGFSPTAGSTVDSVIFDRFEVIKGPSTIFLAADGSPGGIVNKITKVPQATQSTTITAQTGLFDGNEFTLDSTGPVTKDKKLLYRAIFGETYSDGYYKNVYMHRFTFAPSLSYQFTSTTKLELHAELVQTNWPSRHPGRPAHGPDVRAAVRHVPG
jgi:iron complex outermembrane receptor protein